MTLPFDMPIELLLALVAAGAGFLGWLGRGATFMLGRWVVGSPKTERASYFNTVADLAAKLRANGMSVEDLTALESAIRSPTIPTTSSSSGALEQLADDHEPRAFQSTAAMRGRAHAAYEVAEARLGQALMDLQILLDEGDELTSLQAAQTAWLEYRNALEARAMAEFGGGTGGPLAAIITGISETDRRAAELRAEVRERAVR